MNIFQLLAAVSGMNKRVYLYPLFLNYVITHVSRQTKHSQEKYSYLDVAVFYKYEYDSQLFD